MLHNKLFVAVLAASAMLAGCGGSDGDDVTINVTETVETPVDTDPTPDPDPDTGSCNDSLSFVTCSSNGSVATIEGNIDQDFTMTNDVEWRLDGTVTVGSGNVTVADAAAVQAIKDAGVTLTIEAGANIKAFDSGTLLVTRGSRLIADGSASNPITFSSLDSDFDGLGEWGGVIVQGFAPQYGQGGTGACFGAGEVCNVEGEGGTEVAVYGGNDPADDSGVIRYVRIAEGGLVAGPNNEINGLTLQGVGHGTTVEYVQVHSNLDDGVEWFGGTVNAKYLVLTNNDDDDIDFDEGYQGNIQYAIVQKDPNATVPQGSNDPRGIEANSSDDEYAPETTATLANVTIVGSQMSDGEPGMRLRGALTVSIYNSSVDAFERGCVRIDNADINGDGSVIEPSNVALENILTDCDRGTYTHQTPDSSANVSATNVVATTLSYDNNYAINEAEASLGAATTIPATNNGSGFAFDQTNYIGAVDPAAAEGWWEGWTLPGTLLEAAEPVVTSFASCDASGEPTVCTLTGVIDQDYTLLRGVEYRLSGEVLVGEGNVSVSTDADVAQIKSNGVTLTIEPGVDIKAFDDGSLLVTRGSKLEAVGTPASPITFSSLDAGYDGEGEWGGVIVQGFAPQYGQGGTGACFGSGTVCNVEGEGGTVVGNYGGNDAADDSGTIRYVRIAEAGLYCFCLTTKSTV